MNSESPARAWTSRGRIPSPAFTGFGISSHRNVLRSRINIRNCTSESRFPIFPIHGRAFFAARTCRCRFGLEHGDWSPRVAGCAWLLYAFGFDSYRNSRITPPAIASGSSLRFKKRSLLRISILRPSPIGRSFVKNARKRNSDPFSPNGRCIFSKCAPPSPDPDASGREILRPDGFDGGPRWALSFAQYSARRPAAFSPHTKRWWRRRWWRRGGRGRLKFLAA